MAYLVALIDLIVFFSNKTNTYFLVNFYAAMIIITINDICAYYVGFFAGRTPLIKLSPKKTLEVGCQKKRNTFLVLLAASQ